MGEPPSWAPRLKGRRERRRKERRESGLRQREAERGEMGEEGGEREKSLGGNQASPLINRFIISTDKPHAA